MAMETRSGCTAGEVENARLYDPLYGGQEHRDLTLETPAGCRPQQLLSFCWQFEDCDSLCGEPGRAKLATMHSAHMPHICHTCFIQWYRSKPAIPQRSTMQRWLSEVTRTHGQWTHTHTREGAAVHAATAPAPCKTFRPHTLFAFE